MSSKQGDDLKEYLAMTVRHIDSEMFSHAWEAGKKHGEREVAERIFRELLNSETRALTAWGEHCVQVLKVRYGIRL